MIPFPFQSAGLGFADANQAQGAAWNPVDRSSDVTLSNANRTATRANTASGWRGVRSALSRSAGKWYFEFLADANNNGGMIGIAPSGLNLSTQYTGQTATSWGYYYNSAGGEVYNNGTSSLTGSGVVAVGSYARVAIDLDAGRLWFGNASTWKTSGDPGAGTNPTFTFTPNPSVFMCVSLNSFGNVGTLRSTAGQVAGVIPTGFLAWE